MPGWITTVLTLLGVAETALPLIEQLLAGIGKFVAEELTAVFGQADAATKLTGLVAQAEAGIKMMDTAANDVAAELKAIYPTVEDLFAAFPWLPKHLTLHSAMLLDNPGVAAGTVNKLIEAGHGNVRAA